MTIAKQIGLLLAVPLLALLGLGLFTRHQGAQVQSRRLPEPRANRRSRPLAAAAQRAEAGTAVDREIRTPMNAIIGFA